MIVSCAEAILVKHNPVKHFIAIESWYCGFSDKSNSANLDMGKSSFPEGDLDPLRSQERISKTTNDYFFGNVSNWHWLHCSMAGRVACEKYSTEHVFLHQPPRGFRNPIVDGSHLRTKSHVDLGVAKGEQFYETSMESDFRAVSVPYKKADADLSTKSCIPLDYYRE